MPIKAPLNDALVRHCFLYPCLWDWHLDTFFPAPQLRPGGNDHRGMQVGSEGLKIKGSFRADHALPWPLVSGQGRAGRSECGPGHVVRAPFNYRQHRRARGWFILIYRNAAVRPENAGSTTCCERAGSRCGSLRRSLPPCRGEKLETGNYQNCLNCMLWILKYSLPHHLNNLCRAHIILLKIIPLFSLSAWGVECLFTGCVQGPTSIHLCFLRGRGQWKSEMLSFPTASVWLWRVRYWPAY